MQPRRAASESQFSCYGGGGIASLPSDYSLCTQQADNFCSEPTRGAVRRSCSFDQVQSTPGRGYGRSEGAYQCPVGPPLEASSRCGDRPADATFTIDRPGTGGYALDETFQAGPYALDETFTMEHPQCPPSPGARRDLTNRIAAFDSMRCEHLQPVMQGPHPLEPDEMGAQSTPGMPCVAREGRYAHSSPGAGYAPCTPRTPIPPGFARPPQPCPPCSPGSSWSSGYEESRMGSTGTSLSSGCPPPGFHPHLGQQYPPPACPPGGGVSFFLPMSPPVPQPPPEIPPPVAWDISPPPQRPPGPCQPPCPPPIPPPVAWDISPPPQRPQGPCQPPCPPPEQRRPPSPQPGPSGVQRNVRFEECQVQGAGPGSSSSSDSSYQMVPHRDPNRPEILRPVSGPDSTEIVQPVIQGIQRMIEYGLETMNERRRIAQEFRDVITRMQGTHADAVQRLQEFRRMAIDRIQGYLQRATDIWDTLGDHFCSIVRLSESIDTLPIPSLQGIRGTVNVNQCAYTELVRQAVNIARAIRIELGKDRNSLSQLVYLYDNIERQLNVSQEFLPTFTNYITWAMTKSEELQGTMNCSQEQLDRFMQEWLEVQRRLIQQPISEVECEDYSLGVDHFRDPCVGEMSVSTVAPTPPRSPRRATFSPRVSPYTTELQRTPPGLPVRVQQWMRESSPSRLPPENLPYVQNIFNDYDQMEQQAVGEVQHSTDESQSLSDSMNAMGS